MHRVNITCVLQVALSVTYYILFTPPISGNFRSRVGLESKIECAKTLGATTSEILEPWVIGVAGPVPVFIFKAYSDLSTVLARSRLFLECLWMIR